MTRTRVWRLVVVLVAGAAAIVPTPAAVVERSYSAGVYPFEQHVLTGFSNWLPFALFDILIATLAYGWIMALVRDVRRARGARRLAAGPIVVSTVVRTLVLAAVVYLVFLIVWGLNYRRVPLARKLQFEAGDVSADGARALAAATVERVNALYARAHTGGGEDLTELADAFARAQRDLGGVHLALPGRPKFTLLDLYFRRAAVDGMTDPFFLETLVSTNLLPFERPFVIAHEWSHLAGFADEGEANFSGWLTCIRGDRAAQYSGWLFLFDELANSLSRADRAEVVARLDAGPRADLRAIAARLARDVKPQVSAAGWRVYDQYLKANRVEAGAASYAQVVRLVLGTGIGLTADASPSPAR
jgi:hypothetical protein